MESWLVVFLYPSSTWSLGSSMPLWGSCWLSTSCPLWFGRLWIPCISQWRYGSTPSHQFFIRDCVFTNMTQLNLLFCHKVHMNKILNYLLFCFSFYLSRSSLKKRLKGTWISWLSLCCSTAVQRRWTLGLVRFVLGLNLFAPHPILVCFCKKSLRLHFIHFYQFIHSLTLPCSI